MPSHFSRSIPRGIILYTVLQVPVSVCVAWHDCDRVVIADYCDYSPILHFGKTLKIANVSYFNDGFLVVNSLELMYRYKKGFYSTCRSSGYSNSIYQLRWRMDIANISNRLIGPQMATKYCVNTSANNFFCQERTAISQTTRRKLKLAASYDRAYYKLWSPISRFCLRQRSVRFDESRLIL